MHPDLHNALAHLRRAVEEHCKAGGNPLYALALVLRVMVDSHPAIRNRLREAVEKKTWTAHKPIPAAKEPLK